MEWHTYVLTDKGVNAVSEYSDIVDISKFNVRFSTEQTQINALHLQCRPSLAWLTETSFVLGWPCLGQVYRGFILIDTAASKLADNIDLYEIPDSKLNSVYFAFGQLGLGYDNAALVMTQGDDQVSLTELPSVLPQNSCPVGFERARVIVTNYQTLSKIDFAIETLESCADSCISRNDCRAIFWYQKTVHNNIRVRSEKRYTASRDSILSARKHSLRADVVAYLENLRSTRIFNNSAASL